MKKIKILYIPSNIEGGVYYYRTLTPMTSLLQQFNDKYDICITNSVNKAWEELNGTNILVVHNCLYEENVQYMVWNLVTEAKKLGIKTVLDLDDYWNYGEEHPMHALSVNGRYHVKSSINLNLFDCVTTTTKRFAQTIREYGKDVFVLENGISPSDPQFSLTKNESKRIRFGFTGGSSHVNDIKQCFSDHGGIFDFIPKDYMDRMQIVLCGFNLGGKKIVVDQNGKQTKLDLQLDEMWWIQLERQVTKDYSVVSPEYREVLLRYDRSSDGFDTSNEPYRRAWSTSIANFEYGHVYEDIDVLLVPLNDTKFNSMKSEIKFTECGFTNTAIIASNVLPYTDYGTDYRNCLFVGDMNPEGWARKIMELIGNKDLRNEITVNLHNKTVQERNIDVITRRRDKLYSKLIKK